MDTDSASRLNDFLEPLSYAAAVAVALALRRPVHAAKAEPPQLPSPIPSSAPVALVKGKRCQFPLVWKRQLSHDTVLLRFGLPTKEHVLGLPAGQHLFCYATVNGEMIVRAYSTITHPDVQGYFEIPLKVYLPAPPKYPEGGKMSQFLNGLSVGDVVEFKGPVGRFVYEGIGVFSKNRKKGTATKISMIAGGTGINPFMQIIRKVLENPLDMTEISLLYANKTEKDILFHDELDQLASKHWNFSVFYTVEKASWHWMHGRGRIGQKMLERHTFGAAEDSILLLCGPNPMTDTITDICTSQLGWSKDQISVF